MCIFINLTVACLILVWVSALAHNTLISILCVITQLLICVAEVSVIRFIDKK